MKKAFVIFLTLALLLTSGAVWTFADAYKEQDNVIFTENTVYGDIRYADGIDVTRSILLKNARWNSVCSINEGKVTAETDFTYYNFGAEYNGGPEYHELFLSVIDYPSFHSIMPEEDKYTEERKKLQEDFDELTKDSLGNPVTVEFRLGDYYEYYPIGLTLWLPGYTNINCQADYESDLDVVNEFREFFKIPVPDSEVTTVKASVSYEGGGSMETVTQQTNNYFFNTLSVVCDNAAYFTFDNKFPNTREKIDTSLIPGGYGIYRLPYDKSTEEDLLKDNCHTKVYADRLEMVYALDEDDDVLDMRPSFDKTQIYLLTKEDGRYFFTIIDEKTMEDHQKFELGKMTESVYLHTVCDGYVVIECNEDEQNSRILLYEVNDGVYEKKADISSVYSIFDSKLHWNGERLVTAKVYDAGRGNTELWGHYELEYRCGFTLTVYDSEKELYRGNYESSLDAGADTTGWYFCSAEFDDEKDLIITVK